MPLFLRFHFWALLSSSRNQICDLIIWIWNDIRFDLKWTKLLPSLISIITVVSIPGTYCSSYIWDFSGSPLRNSFFYFYRVIHWFWQSKLKPADILVGKLTSNYRDATKVNVFVYYTLVILLCIISLKPYFFVKMCFYLFLLFETIIVWFFCF